MTGSDWTTGSILDGGTSRFLINTIDLGSGQIPSKPGAYLRISEDQYGLERGIKRQRQDTARKNEAMGWGPIAKWYEENDKSAFKKKRVLLADGSTGYRNIRPQFLQMVTDLANGVIDGVIVYDQDRLLRQPRDLEDLIDLCERMRFPVVGVSGNIDLLTSQGRLVARMMAAVAIKSSEDTSRRVARSALADAEAGTTVRGGPRRYGWEGDAATTVPSEVKVIREIRERILRGEGKDAIALDLQARGIPTVTGVKWTGTTVNTLMRNPRLAGIRAYTGVHHGARVPGINEWTERVVRKGGEYVMGKWTPILTVEEWEALQHVLDGRRKLYKGSSSNGGHGRGNPRHLLTGLVYCGECGCRMIGKTPHGLAAYACRPKSLGGCNGVSRNLAKLDDHIVELAIRKLESHGLKAAAEPNDKRDRMAELADEIAHVEGMKAEVKAAWKAKRYSSADYFEDVAGFNAKIEELSTELSALQADTAQPTLSPADMIARLRDPRASVSDKRRVLTKVFDQVLVKKASRGPHFAPADIVAVWHANLRE